MGNQGSKGRDGQRDERDFVRGNGLNSHPLGRQSSVSSAALSTLLRGAAEGHVNDKYTFGATLGTGGYAQVRAATHKENGLRVAIKVVTLPEEDAHLARQSWGATSSLLKASKKKDKDKDGSKPTGRTQALDEVANEIEILSQLHHPSILRLYEHYVGNRCDRVFLVMELLEGGELLEALLARGNYSEADTRVIFKQILDGLEYVHSMGIVHRDVKLENLMLGSPGDLNSIRLIDFGLARTLDRAMPTEKGRICGTPSYLAPEVIQGGHYTPAVDCWAAGVILYILLSGVVPFIQPSKKSGDGHRELFRLIRNGEYSLSGPEFTGVSDVAKSLIRTLMELQPDRRLTASQALDHRWLRLPLREVSSVPLPSAKSRLQETVNRMRLPVRHFEPGEFLLRAGEANNELYLLREGKAEVLAADIDPMLPEGAYDSSDDDMDGGGAGGAGDWNNSNGNGRSGWGSPFGSPERPGTRSHGAGAGAGGALSGGASGGGGYPSNGNGGYGASNNNVMGLDLGGGGRSNTFGSGARGGTFSGESVGSPRGSVGSPRSVFSDSRMVAVSTVGEGDFVGEPARRQTGRVTPAVSGATSRSSVGGRSDTGAAAGPSSAAAAGGGGALVAHSGGVGTPRSPRTPMAAGMSPLDELWEGPLYSVRALTHVQAVVLQAGHLDWVLQRDPMLRHEVEAMIRQRSAQCATLLSTPRGRGANGLNPFLCAIMPWLQPQNGGGGGHSNPMCGVDKGLQQGMNEVGNVFQGIFSAVTFGLADGNKKDGERGQANGHGTARRRSSHNRIETSVFADDPADTRTGGGGYGRSGSMQQQAPPPPPPPQTPRLHSRDAQPRAPTSPEPARSGAAGARGGAAQQPQWGGVRSAPSGGTAAASQPQDSFARRSGLGQSTAVVSRGSGGAALSEKHSGAAGGGYGGYAPAGADGVVRQTRSGGAPPPAQIGRATAGGGGGGGGGGRR